MIYFINPGIICVLFNVRYSGYFYIERFLFLLYKVMFTISIFKFYTLLFHRTIVI